MKGTEIIELKQERATLVAEIRNQMNAFVGKEMDASAKETQSKMENRFDELNNIILREEKQIERERIIGENAGEANQQINGKADEMQSAFKNYLKTGDKQALEVYNALQQSNPTQAGYLVAPETFVNDLIKTLDNSMFMRKKAKMLPPLKGAQSLGYPQRTARMSSAVWGTEIAAPTPDSALSFGKREFKTNPATAEILLSKTLIRNAPGAEGIVRDELAFAFGELMEIAYMVGDGAGKPLGLFTASPDGIGTDRDVSEGNTATEIKIDGLLEAKYSVKDQYQAGCEWIFNRLAIKQLAKLKDLEGQYIWQPSVVLGTPDVLLGKVLNSSEYAPNTFTAGLYAGVYGNLKNYWICDSLDLEIQALYELYARTNQMSFMGRIETDGAPVLAEAFARIKMGS